MNLLELGFYRLVRGMFLLWLAGVFRFRAEGRERLPARGPALLASNHISWWDIPLLAVAVDRPVHFMAKEELFRFPIFSRLIRWLGAFPVRRGTADRQAIRKALEHLEAGRVVAVFIEGTRSRTGELLPAEQGTAFLALRSGAPVVPVGIRGPYGLFRRPAIRLGPVLSFDGAGGGRTGAGGGRTDAARRQEVSDRIMGEIRRLAAAAEGHREEVATI